ncbi:GNAT family N-acetyltransferase [Sphingobacterium sp. KU25419]|nr:GNAT family N-acetyltransferase [Sphingobacterium sp. KU25419]
MAEVKGKGYGKLLLDFIAQLAKSKDLKRLELNVNRNNPAYYFYLKQNFLITETVDIPYHGYVLDDYVMQKELTL